jgi:hypothetical protein
MSILRCSCCHLLADPLIKGKSASSFPEFNPLNSSIKSSINYSVLIFSSSCLFSRAEVAQAREVGLGTANVELADGLLSFLFSSFAPLFHNNLRKFSFFSLCALGKYSDLGMSKGMIGFCSPFESLSKRLSSEILDSMLETNRSKTREGRSRVLIVGRMLLLDLLRDIFRLQLRS